MLHAILFLGALGIVEAVEGAHEVAGNAADALELDACTDKFFLGTGHDNGGFGIHQHGQELLICIACTKSPAFSNFEHAQKASHLESRSRLSALPKECRKVRKSDE